LAGCIYRIAGCKTSLRKVLPQVLLANDKHRKGRPRREIDASFHCLGSREESLSNFCVAVGNSLVLYRYCRNQKSESLRGGLFWRCWKLSKGRRKIGKPSSEVLMNVCHQLGADAEATLMSVKAGYTCAGASSTGKLLRTQAELSVCRGSVRFLCSQVGSAHVCGLTARATASATDNRGRRRLKQRRCLFWCGSRSKDGPVFWSRLANNPYKETSAKKKPTVPLTFLDYAYFADSLRRMHLVRLRAVFFLVTKRILLVESFSPRKKRFCWRKHDHLMQLSVIATAYIAQ
jgi:hypothetical protein